MTSKSGNKIKGEDIRAKVGHPIIDGDGHFLETRVVLWDYVKKIAGPEMAKRYSEDMEVPWKHQNVKPIFWGSPSGPNTIDRATAILPKLFKERLDEAGIDLGIIYTTAALPLMHQREDELRQVGHRALNTMYADLFREVSDRLIPSAVIPMWTPEEALAELDYAINELGHKAATFGTEVRRTPPEIEKEAPHLAKYAQKVYPVAVDALYDYDPVWQRCVDLKIPVACHTSSHPGGSLHDSPSSYVFNHLGGFATGANYFCRQMLMDGVTRRFPELNFAFLEGGAGWASQLYNDFFEHWEKRNVEFMRENLDPAKLDLDLLAEMADKYGDGIITAEGVTAEPKHNRMGGFVDYEIDEFARMEIKEGRDIIDLFVKPFYFGLRSRRRHERRRLRYTAQSLWPEAQRFLWFRYRALGRGRHDPMRAGSLRAGQEGVVLRRRLPRFHVYQSGHALRAAKSEFLQGNGARGRS